MRPQLRPARCSASPPPGARPSSACSCSTRGKTACSARSPARSRRCPTGSRRRRRLCAPSAAGGSSTRAAPSAASLMLRGREENVRRPRAGRRARAGAARRLRPHPVRPLLGLLPVHDARVGARAEEALALRHAVRDVLAPADRRPARRPLALLEHRLPPRAHRPAHHQLDPRRVPPAAGAREPGGLRRALRPEARAARDGARRARRRTTRPAAARASRIPARRTRRSRAAARRSSARKARRA